LPVLVIAEFEMLPGWAKKISNIRLSSWIIILFAVALILPWIAFASVSIAGRNQRFNEARQNLSILAVAYGESASLHDSNPAELIELRRESARSGIRLSLHKFGVKESGKRGAANQLKLGVEHTDGALRATAIFPASGIAATASQDDDFILAHWRNLVSIEASGLILRSLIALAIGGFLFWQLRWREKTLSDLAAARLAAEGSNQAKAHFLANMSHELRTPLNAILGFSEIIKNASFGPISSNYRDYAQDIHNSGAHLLSLINDVLDLSKLEAGQFELVEQMVDLSLLAESSLRFVEPQAQKENIALSHSIEPSVSLIRADERRMRQILINILSNAVKFSPRAGQVSLTANPTDDGLVIQIRDNGIGIPADKIKLAMEPFSQVETGRTRNYQGTGLGLPLAKRLTELHGGTLSLDSEVNMGTLVSITLPRSRILDRADPSVFNRAAG
jgi:signal transduction histidine kinase